MQSLSAKFGREQADNPSMQPGWVVRGAADMGETDPGAGEARRTVAAGVSQEATRVRTFAGDAAYRLNQAVLDDAAEGIYGLNELGFTTFVNPAAYRMTGWTVEDLKGRTQHSMVHHSRADGSHYPVEECPIYKALHDGVVQQRDDEVFWRKDGTCFPVAYTSTPVLRHGKPHGAVVVFRDITQRVKARAWRDSKARVLSSLKQRAPMLETAAHIADAFSIFIGTQRGHGIIRHPHDHVEEETAKS